MPPNLLLKQKKRLKSRNMCKSIHQKHSWMSTAKKSVKQCTRCGLISDINKGYFRNGVKVENTGCK